MFSRHAFVPRTWIALALAASLLGLPAFAQFTGDVPTGPLHNLGALKPPAGSRVAIVVFEDLGCPACARSHPIEQQVAQQHHVAMVRRDFPLPAHVWTFDGAVDARYIEKHISPQLAEEFRSDVFKSQMSISSREDIAGYFRNWLTKHGKTPPFVVDADGALAREVKADTAIGESIHVYYTPTVIVVTANKQQPVTGTSPNDDISRLTAVVEAALAQTGAKAPAPTSPATRKAHK